MNKLTFLTESKNIDAIPYPYPAEKVLPDWFKNMGLKADKSKPNLMKNVSMKVCPGIQDTLKTGYIVPAWCDFYVDLSGPTVKFESASGENFFTAFSPNVGRNFPFPEDHEGVFLKFRSPWRLASNNNLSVIVSQPKYQFNLPWQMYEGIMDLGPYIADINFIITAKRGSILEFKRGDPLIHLFPFETANFKADVKAFDDTTLQKLERQVQLFKSFAFGGFFKTLYKNKKFE